MGLTDILQQYASRATDTHQDFDEVARQVPRDVLADGLAGALRSDSTPPFGSLVGQLFGNSNAQQRSGLLGELLRTLGPGVLGQVAGGLLHREAGAAAPGAPLSPEVAQQISPQQAQDIATAAEKQDPGVLDRVAAYYAQHPDVMKALAGSVLAIALGQIARRMNH